MTKFAILLGGKVSATKRLAAQLEGARAIAADGGMANAEALGVVPELWVGDFDSTNERLMQKHRDVPRQTHNTEKDASDGELAITEALRRGATSLVLVGGFGGQLDHVLVHAGFVLALARRGLDIFMTSGEEEAYGLCDQLTLGDLATGTRISIVPMSDLSGLTVAGAKWPLQKKNVKLGSALTLSNIVTGRVEITLQFGHALVICYPLSA